MDNKIEKDVIKAEGDVVELAERVDRFFETKAAHFGILVLVAFTALAQGLETVPAIKENYEGLLAFIDLGIMVIFLIEMAARIIITRGRFFKNYWSVFDFMVVVASTLPATYGFSVLRILRLLHSMNLLEIFPKTRHVIDGLARSLPKLLNVAILGVIFFYTFSLVATNLFGKSFPDKFGNLGNSMYTLFDLAGTNEWAQTTEPLATLHPKAWVFFVIFIIICGYMLLNLIVGSIVSAMAEAVDEDNRQKGTHKVHNVLAEMHKDIKELKAALGKK